jgi:hypothetical protein
MDRTAELRWFFRRPPPPAIGAWFEKVADAPETRSDSYLLLPGSDALGVKIRGGTTKFELKLRPRPGERLGLPHGIIGQLEEWQRWSFDRPAVTRLFPRLGLPKTHWVEVAKQRRMTTIPFQAESGCRVEFTALQTRGQEWTTVGFESYGPEAELVPALEVAADSVLEAIDLPGALGADLSCGYPGWLATL